MLDHLAKFDDLSTETVHDEKGRRIQTIFEEVQRRGHRRESRFGSFR